MTALDKQLARAKKLGSRGVWVSLRKPNRVAVSTWLGKRNGTIVGEGANLEEALRSACDSYERSTNLKLENKRDRRRDERQPGPSSTTSNREA